MNYNNHNGNYGKNENEEDKLEFPDMQIISPAFKDNDSIPAKYTCDGQNINPPLEFFDVPPGAKSLTLTMEDPDAPMGTFIHWVVWNIDPSTKEIYEHSIPANAMQGITSKGKPGYAGPCPPKGTHRYFFKVYALNATLDLPGNTDKKMLEEAMKNHIIAKGELVGLYDRS